MKLEDHDKVYLLMEIMSAVIGISHSVYISTFHLMISVRVSRISALPSPFGNICRLPTAVIFLADAALS